MYEKLVDSVKGRERADSVHAASWIGIEFMSFAAALLGVFLAVRLVSVYLAPVALLLGIAALRGRQLTVGVLAENDDSLDTLLYWFIMFFAFVIVALGVQAWI